MPEQEHLSWRAMQTLAAKRITLRVGGGGWRWVAHRRQYFKTTMHAAMTHLWLACSKGHIMCTGLSLQIPGLLQARVGMLAGRGHQVLAQRLAALLIQRRHILRVRTCMPPAQVRVRGLGSCSWAACTMVAKVRLRHHLRP